MLRRLLATHISITDAFTKCKPFYKKTFAFFAVCAGRGLQHSGLQLRGTARKRLCGQGGRGFGGLVQLFAGHGQH